MNENTEQHEDKHIIHQVKEETEKMMNEIIKDGLRSDNVDILYKVIDIHKDIENEEYWKEKEENMRYMYGRSSYGRDMYDDSYGRRRRDSRGRFMEGGRGVPGTGRGYRGEDMIDEMIYHYGNYSEGKEMYGADQDTMESYKLMLKSLKEYTKFLKENASTPEEEKLLEHTVYEMSQM